MSPENSKSDSPLEFCRNALNRPVVLVVIMVCLSVAEWFLFRRFFGKYIAHSFLGNWDQVAVYSRIYKFHFGFEQSGINYLLTDSQYLLDKQAMKGLFVPFLGVLMTSIFGPLRLAVISVNFVLFLSGQIAVASMSYRRFGLAAALLSIGLYLLSLTHYTAVGGISDMRLDYSAMIMMGWAFLANLAFMENGGKFRWALASITLLLNVLTRSILIIYWNVALGLLFVFSLFCRRFNSLITLASSSKRAINLLFSAIVTFLVFLAAFWQPFSKYYIFRVTNGEAALRSSAYGCHGYLETLAYNCMTLAHHFQYMFATVGLVFLGLLIFQRQQNEKVALFQRTLKFAQGPFFLLSTFLCVGCLLSISCFMPSPNHIGVMTIPCALFLTLGINSLVSQNDSTDKTIKRQKHFLTMTSCLIFALGAGLFAKEMLRPSFPPGADPEMADLVRRVNEVLSHEMENRDVSHVCFPILSDEWHPAHLEVYWYENRRKALPENYGPVIINPFEQYNWKQVQTMLGQATFVVLPIREPKCSDEEHAIKGQSAIRKLMPQIKEELGTSFYPVAVLDNKSGYSIGIFRNRKP
jgi:hypothetical protein